MDIVNEKKEAEGDGSHTQFDQQRSEAITELMEKSVKQKWQKPTKHVNIYTLLAFTFIDEFSALRNILLKGLFSFVLLNELCRVYFDIFKAVVLSSLILIDITYL